VYLPTFKSYPKYILILSSHPSLGLGSVPAWSFPHQNVSLQFSFRGRIRICYKRLTNRFSLYAKQWSWALTDGPTIISQDGSSNRQNGNPSTCFNVQASCSHCLIKPFTGSPFKCSLSLMIKSPCQVEHHPSCHFGFYQAVKLGKCVAVAQLQTILYVYWRQFGLRCHYSEKHNTIARMERVNVWKPSANHTNLLHWVCIDLEN
jgi:hypothetical protein